MTREALSATAAVRVAESRVGWLTTLRPDGSPHTTPVWFVYSDGVVRVATAVANVKVRNIRADPRVSVAIDGSAAAPLVGQGTVRLVSPAEAGAVALDAFARKYDGWNIADESVDGERVVLEIRVERWLLA